MSVNKFGSSSNSNSSKGNDNKKYTDSKFITLAKNLNTKLDKSGDTMSGSLNMGNCKITNLCDPQESNEAANKKYVDQCKLSANTYTNQRELVAKAYTDLKETKIKSYVDSKEAILRTYIDAQKKITELLVANKYVKNNVGLIPDLLDNQNNKCGFIASAEGTISSTGYYPFFVFNSWKGDWVVESFPTQLERWIKVRCPEPVKIHKFTIKGRDLHFTVGKITDWKFQASMDDSKWDDLYTGNKEFIDYEFKTFQISPAAERYIYYRFIILGNTGDNVGLSHLQIYSADPIM